MIKFDFNSYNEIKVDNYDLSDIMCKFSTDNKMAGWYNINTDTNKIKDCAKKIREKAEVFIVIGIGGSYLGSKAIIDALDPYFNKSKPEILFAGMDLSSTYLKELIEYIKDKEVYINVISKSGTTLETLVAFNTLFDYMKNKYNDLKERIIVTTDEKMGNLVNLVNEYNFEHFVIPNDIGGRYSVLTPVGLLPIAVAGYNIDELITGAASVKQDLSNCFKYTTVRNEMYKSNKLVESFNVYEPKLYYFTEWLKQLFAESQGKNNKGILPISTVNSRDLHSLGQYFQEGNPIIFSTTIAVESNNNFKIPDFDISLDEINKKAITSVALAHYPHTPTNLITIDKINEYNLGYLILFFEISAMLGSYLLDINYYDQPGVNKYKNILNKLINE